MSEALVIICEVHIPGNSWADLWQSQLCAANYLFLWSGFSGWYGSHVPHSQKYPYPLGDILSEYQCPVHGEGRIPSKGCPVPPW